MTGYVNDLYADAPDLVQVAVDAARAFPEGIIVTPWPPLPSEMPWPFRGPDFDENAPAVQTGWRVLSESWTVTIEHDTDGLWWMGGSDDEGHRVHQRFNLGLWMCWLGDQVPSGVWRTGGRNRERAESRGDCTR